MSAYPGFNISQGSSGEYVRQIQRCLNNLAEQCPTITVLKEDGVFGAQTLSAVVAFQQAFDLDVDGIVGKITWGRLMEECQSNRGGAADVVANSRTGKTSRNKPEQLLMFLLLSSVMQRFR